MELFSEFCRLDMVIGLACGIIAVLLTLPRCGLNFLWRFITVMLTIKSAATLFNYHKEIFSRFSDKDQAALFCFYFSILYLFAIFVAAGVIAWLFKGNEDHDGAIC